MLGDTSQTKYDWENTFQNVCFLSLSVFVLFTKAVNKLGMYNSKKKKKIIKRKHLQTSVSQSRKLWEFAPVLGVWLSCLIMTIVCFKLLFGGFFSKNLYPCFLHLRTFHLFPHFKRLSQLCLTFFHSYQY